MADERARETAPTGLFAPLAHRDFALLWGGYIVSHVGDSIQLSAQNWLVTGLTSSGVALGGVAIAQALPRLLLGLFAGVLVDRFDRRAVLLCTQALAMVQSAVFLALLVTGRITYGRVVALAAVLGVLDTLNLNARVAMMPTLVPRPLIGRAIALQAIGINAVQIAGPTIAGLLIGTAGVRGCLAVNVGSFVVLIAALVAMRAPGRPGERTPGVGLSGQLGEGFAFVRGRPLLWASIALAYLLGIFGVAVARLLALFARVVLATTGRGYGFLSAAVGLGAVLASVLVTARARPAQLPRNIVAGATVLSLAVALLATAHGYAVAFACLALVGCAQMAFRSAVSTTIQLETPDRLRGRVISLLNLDFALWSVGALMAGALSDAIARGRARAMPAHDVAHLPRAAVAYGLSATFVAMGAASLLATALLAPRVLRDRASGSAP